MASVEEGLRAQIRNIEAKHGRSMSEWTDLVRASGLTKHGEIIAWLKAEHGMTHGNANRVALVARDAIAGAASGSAAGAGSATSVAAASDDPVAALYAGKKAALRPIHDRVMTVVNGLGGDVEVAPKRGYVSLRRRKQFAMLQPAAAHVDLGLILPGVRTAGRLEAGGTFNAMFSHRVRLGSAAAVDSEVEGWLRSAYDAAG